MTERTWTDTDIDLIHAYIDGDVDEEQGTLVEQRLDGDAAFARLLQTVIASRSHLGFDAIPLPDEDRFDAMEHALMQKLDTLVPQKAPWWKNLLSLVPLPSFADAVAMAAIVAVIVGTMVLVWPEPGPEGDGKTAKTPALAVKKQTPKKQLRKQIDWQSMVVKRLGDKIGPTLGTPATLSGEVLDSDALYALLGRTDDKAAPKKQVAPATKVAFKPNQMFVTSTNEAAAYRLDPLHTIALKPSSRVEVTGYSSGLAMIHIHRGGVLVIDEDEGKQRPVRKDMKAAVKVKALVVRVNNLMVTPVGTVFTVEKTLDNHVNIGVTEGSVSLMDTRYRYRRNTVEKGNTASCYIPQGSVKVGPYKTSPVDDFLKNVTMVRDAAREKQAKALQQSGAGPVDQPVHGLRPKPQMQKTDQSYPMPNKAEAEPPKEPKEQTSMADLAQQRFFANVRLLMSKNQWTSASQTLQDFLGEATPGSAEQEAMYLLGICYERQGKWEDAKRQYERYGALFPEGEHRKDVRQRLDTIIKRLKR